MEKFIHEDEYSKIELIDGIVYGIFKYPEIDLEDAIIIVNNRKKVCNGKSRPMLVDVSRVNKISKNARDYLGTEEGFSMVSASAMMVDSSLSSFLANFFVRINFIKSAIPLKVFSVKEKDKAITWLKEFL